MKENLDKKILLALCDTGPTTSPDLAKDLNLSSNFVGHILCKNEYGWCEVVGRKTVKYGKGKIHELPVWKAIRDRSQIEKGRCLVTTY